MQHFHWAPELPNHLTKLFIWNLNWLQMPIDYIKLLWISFSFILFGILFQTFFFIIEQLNLPICYTNWALNYIFLTPVDKMQFALSSNKNEKLHCHSVVTEAHVKNSKINLSRIKCSLVTPLIKTLILGSVCPTKILILNSIFRNKILFKCLY